MSAEYEHEPVRGLPGDLPAGETVLWQGSPDWRVLARRTFHARKVAIYFGLLIVWQALDVAWRGDGALAALIALSWMLPIAAAGVGLLLLLAWAIGRTTVYTITDRRVVLRYGVALPMAVNVPFSKISSAAIRTYRRGAGDIPLNVTGDTRLAYLHLWPHVRPGRFAKAEPMLRAVPNAGAVAHLLASALRDVSPSAAPASSDRKAREHSRGGPATLAPEGFAS